MNYCKKCVYPFVGVNLHFDDDGICSSCKMLTNLIIYQKNLGKRKAKFNKIIKEVKKINQIMTV